ncbi:MAG: 16S rRNA (cytosine(1402)-N(4))-methyltransferase RsmH [Candidatus Poribacteria bacterium]|nr:16S rRNA (cytosine(1402)-N(4))-methyltransferase RsmH [Candidatus Poribacteria bacterium]
MSETHIPVLRNEILDFIKPNSEGIYVDATIGLGGHGLWILQRSLPSGRLIGIDRDVDALAIAKKRLHSFKDRLSLIHGNFAQLQQLLELQSISKVDGVLMDLGVSSLQLDSPARGFSFQQSGPLDMRMDTQISISASDVINNSSPDKLIQIFREYGEERYAKQIVRKIVAVRSEQQITTTRQLADIIENVYSNNAKRSKASLHKRKSIHPATRVFQALRIEVNSELENLKLGVESAISMLKIGGSICIISFHSLEDRIVKQIYRKHAKSCICPPKTPVCICEHKKSLDIITNRPLVPSKSEIEANPRARSGKLRVAIRV